MTEISFLVIGVVLTILTFFILGKIKSPKTKNLIDSSNLNQKNQLYSILNLIEERFLIIDQNKNVVFANKKSLERFGASIQNKPIASIIRDFDFIESINEVFQTSQSKQIETEIQLPTYQYFKIYITRLDLNYLQNPHVMLMVQDRTDMHKIEKLKSEFIANVSHELRTPLQTFRLGLDTIKEIAESDTQTKNKFLNIMDKETNRMGHLISDLLTLSKIEQEEHRKPSDPINLKIIISEVINDLAPLCKEKNINIMNQIRTDVPAIGDNKKLKEALKNIIENSIKYSNSDKTIEIKNSSNLNFESIIVQDQGIGIPKEDIPKVTERFYRVDSTYGKNVSGTGLGLAIAKHIINQHRGKLVIQSEVGKGSVFEVSIPKN